MAAMPRSSLTPTAMPGRSHTTRDSLSRKMTHSPSRTSARHSHPDWTLDTLTVRSGGFGRWRTVGVAYGQPCETVRETGAGPMSSPMAWRYSRQMGSSAPGEKSTVLGDGSAGDAYSGDEGHAVWVVAGVVGGVEHQRADRVVAAQVTPDLLGDQIRGLRARYRSRAALVGGSERRQEHSG